MTVRKRRHIARTESKAYVNDYVENLILDKMDSFLFNIFFVSLQPKRKCNRLHEKFHRISSRLRPLYWDI